MTKLARGRVSGESGEGETDRWWVKVKEDASSRRHVKTRTKTDKWRRIKKRTGGGGRYEATTVELVYRVSRIQLGGNFMYTVGGWLADRQVRDERLDSGASRGPNELPHNEKTASDIRPSRPLEFHFYLRPYIPSSRTYLLSIIG